LIVCFFQPSTTLLRVGVGTEVADADAGRQGGSLGQLLFQSPVPLTT